MLSKHISIFEYIFLVMQIYIRAIFQDHNKMPLLPILFLQSNFTRGLYSFGFFFIGFAKKKTILHQK